MVTPEVPPERVERKIEDWKERYSVENLEELPASEITSVRLEFTNEVRELKRKYNRGRLVTPEMAEVAGKEPYTHSQLQEIRRHIRDEADNIRINFRRARGRIEREKSDRRSRTIVSGVRAAAEGLTGITDMSLSIKLP
ncbi:hypothetical protein [Halobacterium jilantaiense]|uniref:hypothetical protein n=1 Tax=Halobacterium jilantaiense TaxID=355548 RepID=UPI00116002FB|nr:hypothetical protein [Halobacterium jilantaiense]